MVGNGASIDDLADTWAASSYANEVARDTVDMMYATGGTSSLYVDSPLERAHRDIHAMRRHVIAQPTLCEQVGCLKFGLAPTEMLLAPRREHGLSGSHFPNSTMSDICQPPRQKRAGVRW